MPLAEFGPFAEVFARGELAVPGHLELLGLHQPGAQVVIDRIQRALSLGPSQPWIDALFGDANWRPHLVGAIALILDNRRTLTPASLWHAIDAGSWVLPQLVVSAYLIDPDFPARCRDRIRAGAPVTPPSGLSPADRHSATGQGSTCDRSAKLLASLVTVGRRLPSLSTWIDSECSRSDLVALLTQDVDNAPGICNGWLGKLVEQFEIRGIHLISAAQQAVEADGRVSS